MKPTFDLMWAQRGANVHTDPISKLIIIGPMWISDIGSTKMTSVDNIVPIWAKRIHAIWGHTGFLSIEQP